MTTTRDDIKLLTLREAFKIAAKPPSIIGSWLYLAEKGSESDLDGDCFFDDGPIDIEEPVDSDFEYLVRGRLFTPSLDIDSVQNCVMWADRLAGKPNDAARLEIFAYYCEFDAFPESLGAPAPPKLTTEQWTHKYDLEWYEKLGAEDKSQSCKREGCSRGTIQFSAFCRPHHFEMILKKPCPFSH